jgi:glycosyltransferase involved in cell wall biosynthesis
LRRFYAALKINPYNPNPDDFFMLRTFVMGKLADWLAAFFGGVSLICLMVRYRFSKALIQRDDTDNYNRLRVLLLARNLPFNGDVPRSLLCLIHGSRGQSVDFSVATFQEPGHRTIDAFAGAGLTPICVGDGGYIAPTRRLRNVIAEQNIDVVMATSFKTYLCAKAAIRGCRRDTRIILWLHGMRGALEGFVRRRILHVLLREDPILFASEAVKKAQLPAGHLGNTQVIYNGVEDVEDHPDHAPYPRDMKASLGVPEEALTLAYNADFFGWRDHATAIAAVHELARRGSDAHLLLIGGGPRIQTARALADAGPAATRIHFLGSRSDSRRILELVDIYVHSSRDEGFASAVAEAMLAGRPIVAARDSVLAEYIEHERNGLLFAPGDPNALCDAIGRLANDRQRAAEWAAAARQDALKRFDVAAFSSGVCAFIAQAHPLAVHRRLQADALAQRLRIGPVAEPIAAAG